jgi:hypothetical protein
MKCRTNQEPNETYSEKEVNSNVRTLLHVIFITNLLRNAFKIAVHNVLYGSRAHTQYSTKTAK